MPAKIFQFGPFRLDAEARLLLRDGTPVSITPKVFETLLFLVANARRTVSREELIQAVWPDTFVEEGNLNYNMSQLRKILGEREPSVPYVQTVPKVGYRFVAEITEVSQPSSASQHKRMLPWMLTAALVLFIAGSTWWLWNSSHKKASTRPNLRQLTYDAHESNFPALSPDAKLVAYQSDRDEPGRSDIWVQQTSGGPALRLTKGPAVHQNPVFSADGSKIYFTSSGKPQGIYSVSPLGGEARLVAADGFWPLISPDGRYLAYIGQYSTELNIMPVAGGPPRLAAPGYSLYGVFGWGMFWSPDSRQICFLGQKIGQPETLDVWAVPIDGGTLQRTG